jgi:hypothetical protein
MIVYSLRSAVPFTGLRRYGPATSHNPFVSLIMSDNEALASAPTCKTGRWHLTIFGKSLLLVTGELLANVVCWVIAAITFRKHGSVLSLALLAWVYQSTFRSKPWFI